MKRFVPALTYRFRWLKRQFLARYRNRFPSHSIDLETAHARQACHWEKTVQQWKAQGRYSAWENDNRDKIRACASLCSGRNGTAVELGCESGWFAAYLQSHAPEIESVIGVDIRMEPLNHAAIPVCRADIRRLPLQSHCARLIVVRHVIEHIRDTEKMRKELQRVLQPGGTILAAVPVGYEYDPCHRWYFLSGKAWERFLQRRYGLFCIKGRETGVFGREWAGLLQFET